jgi:hypothetical protein
MTRYYRTMLDRDGHPNFAPYTHAIHEVYYADDGSLKNWTEDAITLLGFDQDDLEGGCGRFWAPSPSRF